jgi:hypothetical protein
MFFTNVRFTSGAPLIYHIIIYNKYLYYLNIFIILRLESRIAHHALHHKRNRKPGLYHSGIYVKIRVFDEHVAQQSSFSTPTFSSLTILSMTSEAR